MKYKPKEYQVGELARFYDVSGDTVRLYDKKGILSSRKKTANNYRLYAREDVILMEYIKRLKTMEISLDDINSIIKADSIEEIEGYFEKQNADIKEKIEQLQKTQLLLQEHEDIFTKIKNDIGDVKIEKSPTFVCKNITGSWQEMMDSFSMLDITATPIITATPSDYPYPDNGISDFLLNMGTRSTATDFIYSIVDKEGKYNDGAAGDEFWVVPSSTCLHSIEKIIVNDDYSGIERLYEQIGKNDMEMSGTPLFRLLMSQIHGQTITDYYESWIPVKHK